MITIAPAAWFATPAGAALFGWLLIAWGAVELANLGLGKGRRLRPGVAGQDGGSFWVIMAPVALSFAVAAAGRLAHWGVLPAPVQTAGLLLMPLGILVRQWAVLTLGRYFSVVVAIESGHRLVTAGPYRWLRHPAYSGGLLALLGAQMALGSLPGAVVVAAAVFPAVVYRIHREEATLLAHFGPAYRAYMARTWRLGPGW